MNLDELFKHIKNQYGMPDRCVKATKEKLIWREASYTKMVLAYEDGERFYGALDDHSQIPPVPEGYGNFFHGGCSYWCKIPREKLQALIKAGFFKTHEDR